jgi:hypothetical protein
VSDENDWAGDPGETSLHGGNIGCERVETVLRRHYFVALGLKRRDQFAEA